MIIKVVFVVGLVSAVDALSVTRPHGKAHGRKASRDIEKHHPKIKHKETKDKIEANATIALEDSWKKRWFETDHGGCAGRGSHNGQIIVAGNGFETKIPTHVSLHQCQKACEDRHGCQYISYSHTTFECRTYQKCQCASNGPLACYGTPEHHTVYALNIPHAGEGCVDVAKVARFGCEMTLKLPEFSCDAIVDTQRVNVLCPVTCQSCLCPNKKKEPKDWKSCPGPVNSSAASLASFGERGQTCAPDPENPKQRVCQCDDETHPCGEGHSCIAGKCHFTCMLTTHDDPHGSMLKNGDGCPDGRVCSSVTKRCEVDIHYTKQPASHRSTNTSKGEVRTRKSKRKNTKAK